MAESPTARIVKLERLMDTLLERVDNVRREIEAILRSIKEQGVIVIEQGKTCIRLEERIVILDGYKSKLQELSDIKGRIDQICNDIADLKDARKTTASRLWAIVPAVIGGLIVLGGTLIINYLKKP